MKRLFQIFGLVLALLWVPITSHCIWEGFIGGDMFKCPSAAEQDGNCCSDEDTCTTDSCGTLETGSYRTSNTKVELSAPLFTVVFVPISILTAPAFRQISPPTEAPSEISASWQFFSRAAIPVRAPSLAS